MTKAADSKKARSGSTSSAGGSPRSSKGGALAGAGAGFGSAATTSRALTPNRQLGELLGAVEPRFCLHPAVEELLLDMASEFVRDVVDASGALAKHRRSAVLEPKDLQLCLAKNYGISLAGVLPAAPGALHPLGQDLVARARPAKNSLHMHRVALKRKALLRARALKLQAARPGRPEVVGKKLARKGSVSALDTK